jgi:hypothetical protein
LPVAGAVKYQSNVTLVHHMKALPAAGALAFVVAAFFAGVALVFFGAGVSATGATVERRARPAAAVVAKSLPFALMTVAGGSALSVALAAVAFALVAFFGGMVAMSTVSERMCR